MSFRDRLSAMNKKAKEDLQDYKPGGGFTPIPDGDYLCIVAATLDETNKEPKRLLVKWVFTVTEGEKEGKQVFDRTIIEDNKVGLQICRQRVELLGYTWPENMADVEGIVESITDRAPAVTCRFKSKDDGEYTNTRTYFREVHDLFDGEVETSAEEKSNDPDQVALLDFCVGQGLDGMDSDASSEAIIKDMQDGKCSFPAATLAKEEIELLTRLGGASMIIGVKKTIMKKK